MPKIGLSRPYVAEYVNSGTNVLYQNGMRMGRAVEFSTEIETSEGNDFYADNTIAETINGVFTGGSLTMTTAELESTVSRMILGLKTRDVEVGDVTVKEIVFDEDAQSPNLGFGVIVKEILHGVTSWRAIVLKKVAFNVPGEDVTTQGEEIEWQTQETSATIMRDDTPKHEWQVQAGNLATEELADKYIRTKLNMPIEDIGAIAVASSAGTAVGSTKITVTPAVTEGNHYMYRVGTGLVLPYYDQSTGAEEGYTAWDGSADITAATGQQILIVETDENDNAKKAGIAVVTAREA